MGAHLDWGLLELSAGPRIRLLRNLLNARSISVSEPFDLPTGSLTVMALIGANEGRSQTELADQAGLPTPSMVVLVDKLEKRGLVTRVRSETDRRRNDLLLTSEGKKVTEDLFAAVTVIEAPLREALGEGDFPRFIAMLDKSLNALRAESDAE